MRIVGGGHLLDTSILVRLDDRNAATRGAVLNAIRDLTIAGNQLYLAPQNIIEFWNVATRPEDRNGLGMTPGQALARVTTLKRQYMLLPETPELYQEWELLVTAAQVSGRQVHDTRLVAFMVVHNIPNILTLNASDFKRFVGIAGISIAEPDAL